MANFPIQYGSLRWLLVLMGLGPRSSGVAIDADKITIRMGWAFRCVAPLAAVSQAEASQDLVRSIGVHGRKGMWLVNGARSGIVDIAFATPQDATVVGRSVQVSHLRVAVENPDALVNRLRGPSSSTQ